MEEEKHYHSKGQEKQSNIMKELEQLNYTAQNEELMEKGFNNTKKNLKLLKKFNGDLNKVLEQQSNKQLQRQQRAYKKLASFGLVEKNEQLVALGFTDVKKNLRCLKQANKDVQGAIARLQQQKGKPKNEIQDLHQKIQELLKLGYKNYKRNQKILQKCDGSIEEAVKFLEKKVQKRELKQKVKQIAGKEEFTKQFKDIDYSGKALYLDGNNILFTDDVIRTTYIKKNRQIAERMLETIAIAVAQKQKLAKLVLIFDGKGQKVAENIGGMEFVRTFAEAENCLISDDYLAKVANETKEEFKSETREEIKSECIFVTSDRELIDRILICGCELVLQSSRWMNGVKELLGEQEVEKLLLSVK